MEGDSWRKNQLLQILENDEYLRALLNRHQDINGALEEIIDGFNVYPGEETGDLLRSLRLVWQEQFLERDYNMICIIDDFLEEEKKKVTRPTWKRYLDSLQIFYNYLRDVGELDVRQLEWRHIEEFLSWWYLRHHLRPSKKEFQGIFPALKKFFLFLGKRRKAFGDIWMKEEAMELRQDVLRILEWESRRSFCAQMEDQGEDYCFESWFQVIIGLGSKIGLLDMNIDDKIIVYMEGSLLEYIKAGDFFSATVLSFDDRFFIEEDSIYNHYPRQARPYIR